MNLTSVPPRRGIVLPKRCAKVTRVGHLSDVSRGAKLHNAHETWKESKEMNE